MPKDMVAVRRPERNRFAEEPNVRIGRSQFDRSHTIKTTFDASYLYPILVDEILPGDTFTCRINGFCRIFSPLDAPIMDNITVETFFFFVPTRLVWDNWPAFNGAHDAAGAQDTDYTVPILSGSNPVDHDGSNAAAARFLAQMGLPDGLIPNDTDVSALPFRAYNLIYNEWFRDQNLIDELSVPTTDGPDTVGIYLLRKSAKRHDYFTSGLPYLQKGDAVTFDFDDADVLGIGAADVSYTAGPVTAYESDRGSRSYSQYKSTTGTGTSDRIYLEGDGASGYPTIYADLSGVSFTVNELRQSVAIQRLLERDARGGTRYVEIIKSHFGVTSPDFRLQRPEYLGGGKSFINISPVANTSDTASVEQGELRGIGTSVLSGHAWAKSFTEHGYVIGLIRARGDLTYFQGLDRHWSRSTRYDFFIPALAHLGEQSILNKEIYVQNTSADDDTFAYQERWAEYRTKRSQVIGKFNPDTTSALSHWHLAEDFASLPSLNQTFIEDATPMSRVTTITTQPDFLLDAVFQYKCARPIPVRSIPSLIGGRF